MKVLRPTLVTDAILTSSSLAEADYPTWAPGGAYTVETRVIRGHLIWEAAGPVAAGIDPLTDTTGKWIRVGATNRWRMFDQAVGSVSTAIAPIEIVLTPGRIDALALLDIVAKQVTVVVTVAGVEQYRQVWQTAIGGRAIDNWYDWFFAPIGVRRRLLFDDLPSYRNGVVTILIEGATPTSAVGVGTLMIGRMFDIGTTLADVDIGTDDYSRKNRDDYGVLTFVERAFSDRNSYQVAVQSGRTDAIKSEVAALRATPTLWIGGDGLDSLLTYGIASTFRVTLKGLDGISFARLEVEGLV